MVEDNGLVDPCQLVEEMGRQQQGVTPEPSRQSGHGRRVAAQRSGELPVGRAGIETGGDGHGELGALEVVGHGEGL
jgi:hypothetical protein